MRSARDGASDFHSRLPLARSSASTPPASVRTQPTEPDALVSPAGKYDGTSSFGVTDELIAPAASIQSEATEWNRSPGIPAIIGCRTGLLQRRAVALHP